MEQDTDKTGMTVIRASAVDFTRPPPKSEIGDLTPADGSVARSDNCVSVFCAQCQRWIDCYDDIPPEVAWERHGGLFH
jgi:hypothetical protein